MIAVDQVFMSVLCATFLLEVKLAKLITSGFYEIGHKVKLNEHVFSLDKKCEMVCECGWNTEITSFENPWCTIETQVRYNDHLIDYGLQPFTKRHSHTNDEE